MRSKKAKQTKKADGKSGKKFKKTDTAAPVTQTRLDFDTVMAFQTGLMEGLEKLGRDLTSKACELFLRGGEQETAAVHLRGFAWKAKRLHSEALIRRNEFCELFEPLAYPQQPAAQD